ncbi:MAG: two-component regulator propeller domain-containing protein [Bacteroidota bacterium]
MRLHWLFTVCSWIWATLLLAQAEHPSLRGDRFVSLTESDGLASNDLHCLLQDHEGFIWIGTNNGLNRFDGSHLQTYQYRSRDTASLAGNNVRVLFEDRERRLWIGLEGAGLCRYDRKRDQFVRYPYIGVDSLSLSGPSVGAIHEDRHGRIWLGYRGVGQDRGGLTCWDPDSGTFSHHLTDQRDYGGFAIKALQLFADPREESVLWIGGRSLIRYDTESREHQEFLHPDMVFNFGFVNDIVGHDDTTLWIGTLYGGILPFYTSTQTWGKYLYAGAVRDLLPTGAGDFWLAEANRGLGYWNPESSPPQFFQRTPDDPLSVLTERDVRQLLYDREGRIWAATGKGLTWLDPLANRFSRRSLRRELDAPPIRFRYLVEQEQQHLLLADPPVGLRRLDAQFRDLGPLASPPELADFTPVCYVRTGPQELLVGGNHGIVRVDLARWRAELLPFSNRADFAEQPLVVYSIAQHSDGRIWFGTTLQGFFHWDRSTGTLRNFRHDPDRSNSLCYDRYLFGIEEDATGNLWVATDKGVSIFDPQREEFLDGLLREGDPVGTQIVHCLQRDDTGRMWMGSRDNGLFCYDPERAVGERVREFTMEDGLLYAGINRICPDASGGLWLSSRKGLSHLDLRTFRITNYSIWDGLTEVCCYFNRTFLLADSTVLNLGPDGEMFQFDPRRLQRDTSPPAVYLQALSVSNRPHPAPLRNLWTEGLELAHDENFFALRFGAIEFSQPDLAQYWYRLLGLDERWIPTRPGTLINYSQLPGGDYRFQLRALNKDGLEAPGPVSFAVRVGIPFWERLWFWALLSALLGLGLGLAYRYRIRQLRLREALQRQVAEVEVMALRSQMNPHFIFNCLNSLKHFIIANEVKLGATYVNKFSKLVRMILEHTERTLVLLSEDWEALCAYVDLEQMRFEDRLTVSYEVAPGLLRSGLQIPPLLVQPYVENAIRHGLLNKEGPGQLRIVLRRTEGRLHYTIEDDGVGRAYAQELRQNSVLSRRSLGMTLGGRRMAMVKQVYGLDCELQIVDKVTADGKAAGTRVEIYLPILNQPNDV